MKRQIGAVILAAGASRRLGQPKQLLVHGTETLIGRVIRLANEAGATPVIAVLGAHSDLIAQAVPMEGPSGAIPMMNEQWKEGIATSIHAGLCALDMVAPDAAGAMILGCDQPRLTADHLRALMEAFCNQIEPAIVASAYAGTLGIPAVFPREVFPDLRALGGDKGARALLMKPPCPLVAVEFAGGEIDIDLPADLAQLE